jgi:NADPH:quinone reductase-like Zn-dependent oxidoreductase
VTSPAPTMRAMRATSPDSASLTCQSIPVPDPGPGELLVEVRATAVTADELTWPETWPAIPCHDLSGVVAADGDGVTGWQPGDEVYGLVGFDRPGAAAEYVAIPAADLAPKPVAVDHVAAAALPLGALTAWQALHEHAHLKPGQHVLVHGGAGGVGAYAVQLAAAHSARVTATASARDRGFVAGLGAGQVIDYSGRFEDQVGDVDVVVDPVGGQTMARSWPVLRAGGILVAIAEEPGASHGGRSDVRGVFFIVRPDGSQLRELATLIDQQQLRPAVSITFELSDLAAAFHAQHGPRPQAKWLSASTTRHALASRPGRRGVRELPLSAAGTVSGSQHRRQAHPLPGLHFRVIAQPGAAQSVPVKGTPI